MTSNIARLLTRHHRLPMASSCGLAPAPVSSLSPPPPTISSLVLRRTMATGTRGARGHGWLQKYRAGLGGRHLQGRWHYRDVDELESINDEVFAMNASLLATTDDGGKNETVTIGTEAFLDLSVAGEPPRRVIIELASAALPKTTENFRLLCQERGERGTGYASTSVYKIEKTVGLCLGDVVSDDGSGGRCHPKMGTYTSPYSFEDEGFFVSHTGPGIVSMMSPGVHRNDSRFLITTTEAPQLDGRFVAFGRVKKGMDVIHDIAMGVFTKRGRPTVHIKIAHCGVV
ncbi:hypothetical protein ACHAXA_009352 [Cyclostephanos tholiformis]|uniref:Peptidyl-prolyl cis-trans isomerase n=1 Tax=Cyclostephanos tholiformis TaxID=382380 RepID=A0ABD3SR35_9STRA